MVKLSRLSRIVILFIFTLLFFSSCKVDEKVEIGDFEKIEFLGIQDNDFTVRVHIPIKNDNAFKFTMKDFDLVARVDGNYLGKIWVADPITVPRKSEEVYVVDFKLKIQNILLGMKVSGQLVKGRKLNAEIEGEVKVKYLTFNKKIAVKEKL